MHFGVSRRQFLTAAVAGTTGVAGYPTRATRAQTDDRSPETDDNIPDTIALRTVTDGLQSPVAVAFAPDADRRYIAELEGQIHVHEPDGRRAEPLVDLRDSIEPSDEPGDEQGLLGMALHPDFASNRRLFVRFSAPRRPEMPSAHSHRFVVAEFQVTDDGIDIRPDSGRVVLEIFQPRPLHNAGDLAFGPDGYLYVPVGDSGRSHLAQNVEDSLLGSVLRIDVDDRTGERAYGIPDDNPLVDDDGMDEHYAWGFRNPWRLSFDGDDLLVADVGQSRYEEVNLVEKGGNYGWDVKEGTHCFRSEECPTGTPDDVGGGEPFVDPVIEYGHPKEDGLGVAVIGGHVSRGSALPALAGTYVFGDFLADGRLFVASPSDGDGDDDLWPITVLDVADGADLQRLLAFGRDHEGEVYALGTGASGGGLFRLVPAVDSTEAV